MPDGTDLIYLYDDTFEGLMTAVFEAYAHRPMPDHIQSQNCQQTLGARYVEITTDDAKAERVINGVRKRIGQDDYEMVWTAFLSDCEDKGDRIYAYIRLGMEIGSKIHLRLADERVLAVNKINSLVGREAHLLLQFIRFSKLEGGIYCGEITPQYSVLPLLMPHFAGRFNIQPFIIHDKTHGQAGVFDRKEWVIVSTENMQLPDMAEEEAVYRRLWRHFYDTVAIKERYNPVCRRNHMPKKYWKNMVELQPAPEELHPDKAALSSPEKVAAVIDSDKRPGFGMETSGAQLPMAPELPHR